MCERERERESECVCMCVCVCVCQSSYMVHYSHNFPEGALSSHIPIVAPPPSPHCRGVTCHALHQSEGTTASSEQQQRPPAPPCSHCWVRLRLATTAIGGVVLIKVDGFFFVVVFFSTPVPLL